MEHKARLGFFESKYGGCSLYKIEWKYKRIYSNNNDRVKTQFHNQRNSGKGNASRDYPIAVGIAYVKRDAISHRPVKPLVATGQQSI